ncbi:SDR family oxidoreductase [Nanoarchaeota archaeon]
MKFLVTGGAGFIGSHIVEELVKRGEDVTVIDDFSSSNEENIKPFINKIKLIKGSICDLNLLQKEFQDIDFVLHQAAISSVPKSTENPLLANEVNINGTLNVLVAARDCGVKKVVFASSSSIYGNSPILPKIEDMEVQPESLYAVQKSTSELYCQVFSQVFGLETVCLRYFNVFGPRQNPESEYSAVIPKFIKKIMDNIQPTVFGDGEQTRDFIYVKDVVEANLLACQTENISGEVFNIASGSKISVNDLISKINLITNKNIKAIYADERKGDVKHSIADIKKSQNKLNFQVKIDFNQGLKETMGGF